MPGLADYDPSAPLEQPSQQGFLGKLAQTWPARLAQMIAGAATLPGDVYQGNVSMYGADGHTNPEVINRAADLAGMITGGSYTAPAMKDASGMGIRAYHGSPHDFDKFDLSKIGTGEGAQAYGHGLYFAENPQTAQAYRDQLSGRPVNIPSYDSPHFQQSVQEAIANNAVQVAGKDVELAKRSLASKIDGYPANSSARNDYQAALDMLHENPSKFAGRMYEVNISADPAHFLDWDKPLSAQPASVMDVLKLPSQAQRLNQSLIAKGHPEMTAGSAYTEIRNAGPDRGQAWLSNNLRDAGIPGIKYLDQGSRNAGDGSRNYVVFNDKLIDIMRKYGLAALPAGGLAAGAMQDGQGGT